MDDYMPDPERPVAYKLLAPGSTKVFVFGHVLGAWPFNEGYIIADSWEDAYEELTQYAFDHDGPCDHGDPPELHALVEAAGRAVPPAQDEWEACWRYVEENCDCESCDLGYVYMVDNWWHGETTIHPYALVKALQALAIRDGRMGELETLETLVEWYEPEEDD